MKVFWLRLYPKDPATGNEVEYLFTSRNHPQATTIVPGKTYLPYLENYPKLEISVFQGEFSGKAEVRCDNILISKGDESLVQWPNMVWDGARAELFKGYDTDTTFSTVIPIFSGLVDKAPEFSGDSINVAITDPSGNLVKELLSLKYLGTGGVEGPTGIKGRFKPLALGKPKGIEPVLINAPNVVFQYSGYAETVGVQTLWENGLSFGAKTATIAYQGSVVATYNALVAQALTVGQWADAPSIGMFRLGGEPVQGGVITADVHGIKKSGGALITTLADCLEYLFTVAGENTRLDTANLTALQTNTGGMTVSDYFLEQENINEIIERYLQGVGGYYFYNTTGGVRFNLVRMNTPTYTLATDGRTEPVVEDLNVLPVSAPFKELRMGVDKNFRVHGNNEISDALLVLFSDPSIQNDQISLTSAGVLVGAGGGTVNALDLLNGPNEADADVTAAIVGQTPITMFFESDGVTLKSGEANKVVGYRLFRNGVDVTEATTWSKTDKTGTHSSTINNTAGSKGQLTIASLSSSTATTRLTAIHGGLTRTFDITLNKDIAAASTSSSGGSQTNGVDTSFADTAASSTSAAPSVNSDEITITLASGVTQARCILYAEVRTSINFSGSPLSWSGGYKVQWWNGSAWVDVNSYVTTSPNYSFANIGTPQEPEYVETMGVVQFNVLKTGLTAASTNKFRLVGYKISGTGSTTSGDGQHPSASFQVKGDGT